MNLLMAAHAQAPEIALVMRPAIGERLHVMDKRCHRRFSHPEAFLAQGVRRDVSVTDFLPYIAVSLMVVISTGKLFIVPPHQFLMLLAVARLAGGQLGASTEAAGTFRFPRHLVHLRIGNAPVGNLPRRHFSMVSAYHVFQVISSAKLLISSWRGFSRTRFDDTSISSFAMEFVREITHLP